jgi:broad specificity phosphatase PhoE
MRRGTAEAMDSVASEGHAPKATGRPGRIIVVRHGRPALDRAAGPPLDAAGYRDWWARYEAGSLADGQKCPPDLIQVAAGDVIFLSSERPRAKETAARISNGRPVKHLAVFNEAPLPPPRWSERRRFLPKTWNIIARSAWLLGHADGDEHVKEARARARAAADVLIETAGHGRDVVVAAHGWFNRMLRRPLARRGWRCVRDGGDSYWSYRIYEKR